MLPHAGPHLFARLRDHRLYLTNPTFANPGWDEASPRVLILRLSSFVDVSRSAPHLFLAGEIRRACGSAYIDMAFLPQLDDARLMQEAGLPLILGTQSHFPLERFDCVLVSNSHLLELVNLPFLLSRSGIPLWASQRDGRWPPVILGGSNATAAHSLVSADGDCMVDAIFFGEGEGAVARIVKELAPGEGLPRKARLGKMSTAIDGLWTAGSQAREISKARCDVGLAAAEPVFQPVLPGAEATTARLSITLGCPCLCSFCFEGHDRRPFREIPAEALLAAARKLKTVTGSDTLELSSFNFNTHSELPKLLVQLHRLFLRVNLMSQRVDILARTPGLLDLELAADKRSFTLGIEGISGRQRRFLHKSLSSEDITRALEDLSGRRTREVKLFYILTGEETEEDFAEFAAFVKWLKEMRRRADAPPRTVFSFGMLVRMPFTPLRYHPPMLLESAWRPLAGRAKSVCETNGFEFRLSYPWPDYSITQLLALSHSSLADLLVRLSERGCVSDSLPPGAETIAEEWVREHHAQIHGEKSQDHQFAFSFLETENARKALHRRYLAAKAGKDAGYAARPGASSRRAIPAESVRELAAITQAKHKLLPVFREALFAPETAGLGSEWKESWLMRRLLALCPGQADNVLSVRESLLAPSGIFGSDVAWFGRSVAAVTVWDPSSFSQAVRGVPELFGREIQRFTPGNWTHLHMSLSLPAAHFPDPVNRLAVFLKDSHAPATIRRAGDSFDFVLPDTSARKKVLLAGKSTRVGQAIRMELTIGVKFKLGDFLDSFGGAAARGALVEVLDIN